MKKSLLVAMMASLMLFASNLQSFAQNEDKKVLKSEEKEAVMIDDTKMQQEAKKVDKKA